MVFGNGVKNIQAAAYNGARTVHNEILSGNQKSILLGVKNYQINGFF